MDSRDLLTAAAGHAADFLDGLPERRVGPAETDPAALRAALGGPLPDGPEDPRAVLDALVAARRRPDGQPVAALLRLVLGGSLPAALAADWVASAWDQNARALVAAPAAAVAEEVVGSRWPSSSGLPATRRSRSPPAARWPTPRAWAPRATTSSSRPGGTSRREGLTGAPPIRLLANGDFHVTLGRAVRLLGLGDRRIVRIETDDEGGCGPTRCAPRSASGDADHRLRRRARSTAARSIPSTPCAIPPHEPGPGYTSTAPSACGPAPRPRTATWWPGSEGADSWAVDGHKWLNVP